MNPLHGSVASRAGYRCEYCRAPEAIFNFPFEVEHIVPVSRHGTDEETPRIEMRGCRLPSVQGTQDKDHCFCFFRRLDGGIFGASHFNAWHLLKT